MMKQVFLIGGMSESGKSTVGKYLDTMGIRRLKIVTFMKMVMEREAVSGDFVDWNERVQFERPDWLKQRFLEEFLAWTAAQGIEYCCLESLYGPDLGAYVRKQLGTQACVVWVNMPIEIRLQRQIIRENLGSIEEAEAYLLPRDERKKLWRVPEIEAIADVRIDNSGTMEELYRIIDRMVEEHCPGFRKS